MTDKPEPQLPAAEIERRLLAALCAPALHGQMRAQILECLSAHPFANPDHEVIFRALLKMPPASPAQIRETLSARVTRLGFPDIDVEQILQLAPPSPQEISGLLQRLRP